jgi:pilus assembly protein TadC
MSKIPYLILPPGLARKTSGLNLGAFAQRRFPKLGEQLEHAGLKYRTREYLSICIVNDILLFIAFGVIIGLGLTYAMGFFLSFWLTVFVLSQQLLFPRVVVLRKVSRLERNLLPALQDMHVQVRAGIPLYQVMANIAHSKYGEVSAEFRRAVDRISGGEDQLVVLQDMAESNPSVFFRRTIWQISNGMRSGADVGDIVQEMIHALSEEQVIQLQQYGSQLNPLVMMYMMLGVIAPSLAVAFMILLTSFIATSTYAINAVFIGIFIVFVFCQTVFLATINKKRPNLL